MAASYARSADGGMDAIAAQHAQNARCALDNGHWIPDDADHRFSDPNTGGNSTNPESWPGLARLLATLPAHQGERITLYVRDPVRLSRHEDPRILVHLEDTLRRSGIDVVYLSIGGPRTTPGLFELFERWSTRPKTRQRRHRAPPRSDHR